MLAAAIPATAQAASRQINFDDFMAPSDFFTAEKLTTRYQSLGVLFSGPAANQGGEILNQGGGFGVSGHSPPNFLAFNQGHPDNPNGPETLQFSPPANSVAVKAGSNGAGTMTMTAFDGATIVAETSRATTSALATLSVAATRITSVRVAFSTTTNLFVIDDLVWSSPPVAAGDSYSVTQGSLVTDAPGVLANDSDADGDLLSTELVTGVAHGALDLRPAGDFTYTPSPGFSGQDSFTYRAVGAGVGSAQATVTFSVTAVPSQPPSQPPTQPSDCEVAIAAVEAAQGKVEKAKEALADARSSGKQSKIKKAKKKLKKAKKKLKQAQAALC